MLFTVPSTGGFDRITNSTLVSKIHKKTAKQENSTLFKNSILHTRRIRVETKLKLNLKILSLCPVTSTKKAVQEFHLTCSGNGEADIGKVSMSSPREEISREKMGICHYLCQLTGGGHAILGSVILLRRYIEEKKLLM
jgi:hypothetical protein